MIVSDKDSENKVYTTYEEAGKEFDEKGGYVIINFTIMLKKYYMVTYE